MDILIKNVDIVNFDGILRGADIAVENGAISRIGRNMSGRQLIVDGRGLHAFYGFCDLHSHLRDPGQTHKEDILTGTRAAAAGGYTDVCCMPNTTPPVDDADAVEYILDKSKYASANVLPVACITRGMSGGALVDFLSLKRAGAIAFSDDGRPVEDEAVLVSAMKQAAANDVLLMLHEEDLTRRERLEGVANEGDNARKAGLAGIPADIEDSMTERDVRLAQKYGARVHICHVSTRGSVDILRRAKKNGANITCETGPHYFSATDAEVGDKNPNAKVNPPLRSEADRQAVIEGLIDGTIDAIATDHAPHSRDEKAAGFEDAPFGLIGFESAFSLAVTYLYDSGALGLERLALLMSKSPREIIRTGGGIVTAGEAANLALCDIGQRYTFGDVLYSKSCNSPFIGRELSGRVIYTIKGGNLTHGGQADK